MRQRKKTKPPPHNLVEEKKAYICVKKWCYLLMIRKHQPNKKTPALRGWSWHYLRLFVLRAFALGVTLTVIVTGTVTLRVVREGVFFFFVAIELKYLLVIKIVLQGSWIYRVLPCMLFCSCSYFCLAFWCCIRLCALRQNSVRDTLKSLIYLRLSGSWLYWLWCSFFYKLLALIEKLLYLCSAKAKVLLYSGGL